MKKILLLSILLIGCRKPDDITNVTPVVPPVPTCNYVSHLRERDVTYNGLSQIVYDSGWYDAINNEIVTDCSKLNTIYQESDVFISNTERVYKRRIVLLN